MINYKLKASLVTLGILGFAAVVEDTQVYARPIPPGGGGNQCLQVFMVDHSQGLPPYRQRMEAGVLNSCGTKITQLTGGLNSSLSCVGGPSGGGPFVGFYTAGSTAMNPNETRKVMSDVYGSCDGCEYTNGILSGKSYLPKVFHWHAWASANLGTSGARVTSNQVLRDIPAPAGPSPADDCPFFEGAASRGGARGPAAAGARVGRDRRPVASLKRAR